MSLTGAVIGAVLDGLGLAAQFNPLFALVSAALAAALSGYPRASSERTKWTVLVVACGWFAGDGLRVLGRARDIADGVALIAPDTPSWSGWIAVALWAAGSLALGYVVPTLVGVTVGRRVTHGTGWLAAAGIAAGASVAISVLVGAVS